MRVESIAFEKLPTETPNNAAIHYMVGYRPLDAPYWWLDFVIKAIVTDKNTAIEKAKRLQEKLERGTKFMPELDSTRMWRVCIVDIDQHEKPFSQD